MEHQPQQDFDPVRVTLTVISGRDFHGRKKGALSVVFGIGKELYQTETIQSPSPYWNQEAHVNVAGKANDSLVFKVKDQGHTFAILKIPIRSITRKKREAWYPVQPYKKEKECHGEICLSCFVSEIHPHPDKKGSAPVIASNNSTDHSGDKKGLTPVGGAGAKVSPSFSMNRKIDNSSVLSNDSGSLLSDEDNMLVPEVTGISPSEGSIKGNERVILRGSNLGQTKEDIMRVTIANVECLETLEYFSSGKLAITTLPRKTPAKGPVIIETSSGGIGISSLHYSYIMPISTDHISTADTKSASLATSTTDTNHTTTNPSPLPQIRGVKLTDLEINELQADNRHMKQQIKELKDANKTLHENNTALKEYVEHLLSTILEHKPELLEIAHQNNPNSNSSVKSSPYSHNIDV